MLRGRLPPCLEGLPGFGIRYVVMQPDTPGNRRIQNKRLGGSIHSSVQIAGLQAVNQAIAVLQSLRQITFYGGHGFAYALRDLRATQPFHLRQ